MRLARFIALVGMVLFVASCKKNQPISWDTNITGPIVYSTMGLESILPDSLLTSSADSSLMLSFSDTIYSLPIDEFVEIPDTTINEQFSIPVPSITVNPGTQFINDATEMELQGVDASLSEVIIKRGYIDWQLESPITEETIYTYSIPDATLNGVPFEKVITVPPGSQSNPVVLSGTFDLSGYHIDLTGSGSTFNTIASQVSVETSPSANPVTVTSSDVIVVENTFRDVVPLFARGYFGQRSISEISPGIPFQSFSNFLGGSIDIDSIYVNLILRNGIGVDAQFTMNSLTSVNGGNTVPLSHNIIGNPININRAINTGSDFTTTDYSTALHTSNSNIDLFVENIPSELGYDIDMEINPLGNVSNGNDFVYCESSFDILMEADMPLSFIANGLTLQDTFDIDIEQEEQGGVKRGTLHLILNNGFPLEATATILLFDEMGQISDTLTTTGSMLPATVDVNNMVTSSTESVMSFTANAAQTQMLYDADQLAVRLEFSTPPSTQHYKIYSHYTVDVKVTADLIYTVVNE